MPGRPSARARLMYACAVSVPLLCCSAPRAVRIIADVRSRQSAYDLPQLVDGDAGDPLHPVRPVRRHRRLHLRRTRWCARRCTPSSIRSSRIAMCSSPLARARSVPGRGARCSAGTGCGRGQARVDHDVHRAVGPPGRRSTAWPAASCRPGCRRPAGSLPLRRGRTAGRAARGRCRRPGCRPSPPTTCRTGRCSRWPPSAAPPGRTCPAVGLLVGQPAAAEHPDAVRPVPPLRRNDAVGDDVERLVPAGGPQRTPAVTRNGAQQRA